MSNTNPLSRRSFLKSLALTSAGMVTWGVMPKLSHAANIGNGSKVLFLNLNGGLDGLYAMQPTSGALYSTLASMRPTLTLDPATLLTAGGGFGFHPNLTVFKSLYDSGDLAAICNVGYQNMSRSHLDSETVMARGVPNRLTAAQNGFLNRLGAYYGWNSLNAVSVTGTDLAFEGGDYRGLQVGSLQDYYYRGFSTWTERNHLVGTAYSLSNDSIGDKAELNEFARNFALSVDTTDTIKKAVQDHAPAVSYQSDQFGRALKDIDTLFSTPEIQTQVGYIRVSGFDTHSTQGTRLSSLLQQLNDALTAFTTSMKAKGLWNNLTILVYSEFGRTNRENGSNGTDHGGANSMFLLGGPVNGGQVIGSVATTDLTGNGWLPMNYNVVEVFRRIIERLGLDPNAIFAPNEGPSLGGIFS